MQTENKLKTELYNPIYVPVNKDSDTYYGGSQMWFPTDHRFSESYVLHKYGCGTIATADLFLYLALQNHTLRSPETEIALCQKDLISYPNYETYVRLINDRYTRTKRIIAVLGTRIATAINDYSNAYGYRYQASWVLKLTYYDMLNLMEEMLSQDIPVILSIGPNTPNLWGKKGISFYTLREIDYKEEDPDESDHINSPVSEHLQETNQNAQTKMPIKKKKPYYYMDAVSNVNGHYVTVTGIIKDNISYRIMLRISSWGKQYYINYEEYREYIENYGDTFTSSMVYIKKKDLY